MYTGPSTASACYFLSHTPSLFFTSHLLRGRPTVEDLLCSGVFIILLCIIHTVKYTKRLVQFQTAAVVEGVEVMERVLEEGEVDSRSLQTLQSKELLRSGGDGRVCEHTMAGQRRGGAGEGDLDRSNKSPTRFFVAEA